LKQKEHLTSRGSKPEIYKAELKRFAEGAGITFVGKILGAGAQYLYIIVVARILGGESFGLFSLGLTIISLAGVIGLLGLDNGVIRYVASYRAAGDKQRVKGAVVKSLQYSFTASVFIGIVLFLAAKPISANIFNKPELGNILKLMSLSLPFWSLMIIALSATKGFQIMRYTVCGRDLFWPISSLILVLIFFFAGLRLYGVVVSYMMSVCLTSALSIYFLVQTFPEIKYTQSIPETRKLLRLSVPLLLVTCLSFLVMWTDTLMLGHFRSSEEVGIYNAAMRTAFLASMMLACSNAIFAPMISDLHSKGEIQKLESLFKTTTKWIYTMSLVVFLLIATLSKEIMTLFGAGFAPGKAPMIILAFAQLVNAGVGAVAFMLVMTGWQDIVMYGTMGVCLLNIILNLLLIPPYGIVGASIASGTSVIFLNVLLLLRVYRLLKMHPYNLKFVRNTALTVVAFSVLPLIKYIPIDFVRIHKLLISVPLSLAIFASLLYKWGFDDEDRFIVDVLQRRLHRTSA
jgi:O-antigen/teichoic acid export membrane protein